MSSINNKILQMRREAIAPELNADYRQLENDVPRASKLLFRDDLKSRLTELKACNKASKGALKGDLRNKLSSKNSHGGLIHPPSTEAKRGLTTTTQTKITTTTTTTTTRNIQRIEYSTSE